MDRRAGQADFFAAAYRNEATGAIVIAFRGTDSRADLATYPGIGSGLTVDYVPVGRGEPVENAWGSQLRQAKAFTEYIRSQNAGAKISFTGHSLGGAIAQVEAARTGWPGDTFNAPGVQSTVRQLYPETLNHSANVRNHHREGDVVSRVGTHFGPVVTYPSVENRNMSSDPRHVVGDSAAAAWDQHRMNFFRHHIESQYWEWYGRLRNPWSESTPAPTAR